MKTWTANDYISRSSVSPAITADTTNDELGYLAADWVFDALEDGDITIDLDDMVREFDYIRTECIRNM